MLKFNHSKFIIIIIFVLLSFSKSCKKGKILLDSEPSSELSKVKITFPEDNCKVFGKVAILCTAFDTSGIKCVELWIDGQKSTVLDFDQPFKLTWDTNIYKDETNHTITVRAYFWNGTNKDSETVHYLVDNSNYQKILFRSARESRNDIYIMNIDGTYQHNISKNPDSNDGGAKFIINGKKILFNAHRNDNHDIYTMDINGDNQINISNSGRTDTGSRYSPTDSMIYFLSDRNKEWGNCDIFSMELDGSNQQNLTNDTSAINYYSISKDGSKIVYSSKVDTTYGLFIMDKNGQNKNILVSTNGNDYAPKFSSDGELILFESFLNGSSDIYTINVDGSNLNNLSNHPAIDTQPKFSPNGDKILFISRRNYNYNIFMMNLDGSGQTNLSNSNSSDSSPRFTKNSNHIIFIRNFNWPLGREIFIMNADGSNQINLTNNTFDDGF